MSAPAIHKGEDRFFCRFLNTRIAVVECVDGYVNANSLNIRHSPCYRCPLGVKVRLSYANS